MIELQENNLECGGLTPLSTHDKAIRDMIPNSKQSESGVKPPHSKRFGEDEVYCLLRYRAAPNFQRLNFAFSAARIAVKLA